MLKLVKWKKNPIITGLVTNSALIAVENKMANANNLIKKRDYNTKKSDIEKKIIDHDHEKYITTLEFNTLAARVFNARLAQANLITKLTKTDFDATLRSFRKRITSNKTNHLLVENEVKNYKSLIQAILEVKDILKKIVLKII